MLLRFPRPFRGRLLFACSVALALATTGVASGQATAGLSSESDDAPRPWSNEVRRILERFFAGAYVEVQDECAALLRGNASPPVRRDALALWSIALLRSASRSDRADGFSRLKQLALEEPGLLNRPECLLAAGLGQLAQHQTAVALDSLDAAAEGYAKRGDQLRQAESLIALARAWAIHNEWNETPLRFGVPVPDSAARARRLRREQIAAVRRRAENLADGGATAAHVDLVLAELLLRDPESAGEGLALAERLASVADLTPVAARAAVLAGETHERGERWSEALRHFERAAQSVEAEVSAPARQRVEALKAPRIELISPRRAASGAPVALRVRARNLVRARLEVRRFDLLELLGQKQGRYSESALPVAGSLQFEADLAVTAAPLAWWESTDEPRLRAALPVGAYCVQLLGEGAGGQRVEQRRLLLVSDLEAAAGLTEDGRVLVWAVRGGGPTGESARALFWMQGSFVPKREPLAGGVAHFDLPPEARVLVEKRWVCVAQEGEHLALCEGELPRDRSERAGTALIDLAPRVIRPGEAVTVVGLLDASARRAASSDGDEVEVLLIDEGERVRRQARVPVEPGGVVHAVFAADAQSDTGAPGLGSSQTFTVALKAAGRSVESVRGPDTVRVARQDEAAHQVELVVPRRTDPSDPPPVAEVRAGYPWGVPIADMPGSVLARVVGLPPLPGAPRDQSTLLFRTNPIGRYRFLSLLPGLRSPEGELALSLDSHVAGYDGRMASVHTRLIRSASPAHLWIRTSSGDGTDGAAAIVGKPVRFLVGGYSPGAGLGSPKLEVLRGESPDTPATASSEAPPPQEGEVVASLSLISDGNELRSEPWTPPAPGDYTLRATFATTSSESHEVRQRLSVAPAGAAAGNASLPAAGAAARAHFAPRALGGDLRLHFSGRNDSPLLVVASAGRRLEARALEPAAGRGEVRLPFRLGEGETWVRIWEMNNGPESFCALRAEPDPLDALRVQTRVDPATPLPGTPVSVSIRCARSDGRPVSGFVVARLLPAFNDGDVPWAAGDPRPPRLAAPRLVHFYSAPDRADPAEPDAALPLCPQFAWPTLAGLLNGIADDLQVGRLVDGETRLELLPPAAQLYRLVIVVRSAEGDEAVHETIVDARRGFELHVAAPRSLSIGDRCPVGVRVRAGVSAPRDADLSIRAEGLVVERLSSDSRAVAIDRTDPRKAALQLRPGSEATILATLEATAVGRARIEVRLSSDSGEVSVAAGVDCSPLAPELATAPAPQNALRIERSLFRLVRKQETDPRAGQSDVAPRLAREIWVEEAIPPGTTLNPGDRILVREVVSCDAAVGPVIWSQRIPPTCFTMIGEAAGYAPVGPVHRCDLDTYVWQAPRLNVSPFRHEFVIVAVRPGVARIPWPTVVAESGEGGKNPPAIEVTPPESVLVVGGG